MNCWVIHERPARPECGDLEVTSPLPHPVSLVWIMWSEAGLNISHRMGPGGGRRRPASRPSDFQEGAVKGRLSGSTDQRVRGSRRRLRDAERPLPASRIAATQPEARSAAGGVKTSVLRRAGLQTRGIQVYEKSTQLVNIVSSKNAY